MGKTKEVDEWVAAGEDDHKTKGGVSSGKQAPVTVAKDAGDGLRGMPGLGGNADREPKDSVKSEKDDVEDESWMFKTFSKANLQNSSRQQPKKEKKVHKQRQPENDFMDPFLPAGLNDLLQFDQAPAFQPPPQENFTSDFDFFS